MKTGLKTIEAKPFENKLKAVDEEFKDFLNGLSFKKDIEHDKLKTFSPLDAVANFEQRGLQAVKEPSSEEMLANDIGFTKLLANMLAECKPGALSDDDLNQFSGINGREVHAGL
ncbi:hypothetical protein BVY03_03900 [bacterium K02(2017)]|nr:hypothetical protein BVY03_03900 [bacterium K02(2017)]